MSPLRALPLLLAAVALSGCISLFPKSDPAQLYRFGANPAAPTATGEAAATPFGILKPPASFPRAAASDRILTVTGSEAAYIADARWVSPAILLFEEALQRAFDANPGPARIVTRGETRTAEYAVKLDVRRFEAVYDHGPKAAPRVVVEVRAVLTQARDRSLLNEHLFTTQVRAGDNRVGAIVAAFDQAVDQVLGQIVGWTNVRGAVETQSAAVSG